MEFITKVDIWLNREMTSLWSSPLNEIMIFITNIASPVNLSLLSILLLIALIIKKKRYYTILFITGMAGGLFLEFFIKVLTHRERPLNAMLDISGYSFPSGHATMATIFFILLLYALKDDIKNNVLRMFFIITTIFAFIVVGLSRVYLNVHWFSDVIAGFALGIFWLTVLVIVFKFIFRIDISNKGLNKQ